MGFVLSIGVIIFFWVGASLFETYYMMKVAKSIDQADDLNKDIIRRLDKILELLSSRTDCNPTVTMFGKTAQLSNDVDKLIDKPNKCVFCGETINKGEIKCEECKKK